ncbi:hypothetical protein [Jeotgalibacillus soli]|uniref:Uncharacterized protein n=1 Tax=Jeotgalibacillus soli TaxID=889306 RepID=A0A0C2RUI9_9BACL|nr:hypothetical protein [Jeotgalibacillus soli]KIL45409.1 hypothetical protein KP78_29530 [Jeotgalibacillus soli]
MSELFIGCTVRHKYNLTEGILLTAYVKEGDFKGGVVNYYCKNERKYNKGYWNRYYIELIDEKDPSHQLINMDPEMNFALFKITSDLSLQTGDKEWFNEMHRTEDMSP